MKYLQFAADEQEFNTDSATTFYEFRPGLLPADGALDTEQHPGFDFDNGGLYKFMRPAAGDVWGVATLVAYCSLDQARETMKDTLGSEYYEYAAE